MCAVAPSCMSGSGRSDDTFLMKVVFNQDADIYISIDKLTVAGVVAGVVAPIVLETR